MKSLSRKSGAVLLSAIAVVAMSACSDDKEFDKGVPNTGVGTVQASQVIAASPAVQHYYAEQYAFSFNEDGLLASIRNVVTGEVEVTYEYRSVQSSPSEQSRSTGALPAGQVVLMTIRQADTYVFQLRFAIGGNGYANSCSETDSDGDRSSWRFSYNADGRLVRLNDDGDVTSFVYDAQGRMTSYYNHDADTETTFSYGDALCTAYPTTDMEWIYVYSFINAGGNDDQLEVFHKPAIQNSLGLFPAVSDFYYEDPEFIYAYLAGLVGKLSSELPARRRAWDSNYAFLYLIENDAPRDFKAYRLD